LKRQLSQQEIDAVFQNLEDRKRETPAAKFDFRRPDRIPKSQVRAIYLLHDTFVRNVVSSLSAYLRSYLTVNLVSVEQLSYAEFLDGLPSPTCLVSLGLSPYDGNGVMELNPSLVFPILEMLLGGTTTFTDMYYFEDVVAEVAKEAGMRGVLGETIIGFPVADAKTPADALKFTERYLIRFRGDPLVTAAVAPHALYTNSDETLKAARALANKYNAPLVIHLAETKKENDDELAKRHTTPTKTLDTLGVFNGRTLAAHCVWVNDADMAILKARNVGVAHCPSSNMKLASGIAPVVKQLALGIPVGVGTDGPAGSNNDFDLMEEMNLAANLQKVSTGDPTVLNAEQAVAMATILGARVAGLEKEIGSLEPGKRADLIALRLDRPHAIPLYNVYSQIVYALKGSDVQDVVVNGKPIVREGRSLTLDQALVLAKAKEYGAKVAASLK